MQIKLLPIFTLFICVFSTQATSKNLIVRDALKRPTDTEWLVVGAGPAGILTVGLLHDLGVPYSALMWVDPEFNVGRIGAYYQNVPANNKTGPFIDFINDCATFNECSSPELAELRASDPNIYPNLGIVAKPLQAITNYLRAQITSHQGRLEQLHFGNNAWNAQVNGQDITARHVVLATGAEPKILNFDNQNVIPLDYALDQPTLATLLEADDVVGVFGSSHSAILLLKFLYELNADTIINFYRSPLQYAIETADVSLNSIMGLKGATAQWARDVLEAEEPPHNIIRAYSNNNNCNLLLPLCDKVIYAIGYKQAELPLTSEYDGIDYDATTGIIAPRLFGIGLAFPEKVTLAEGEAHRVGLTSFMDYAQRVIPQWLAGLGDEPYRSELYRQHRKLLEKYSDLFVIDLL